MFPTRFNSRPVHNKHRRPPPGAPVVVRPANNDFDPIDAGFEDIAAGPQDVQVAPGVMAHFGQYAGDASYDRGYHYHSVPVLERIAD